MDLYGMQWLFGADMIPFGEIQGLGKKRPWYISRYYVAPIFFFVTYGTNSCSLFLLTSFSRKNHNFLHTVTHRIFYMWLIRRALDWIYCTLYIHNSSLQTIQPYRWSTHALGFSVLTSRILATDL
jgi:hypothetical protein